MATDYLWLQSEVIRKKAFPVWATKKFNVLTDFFKKGEVEKIGERDYRIPFGKYNGGRIGTYNPQMGDMGRGSAMAGGYMTGSYFPLRLAFELDMLTIKATQDSKIALADPFKKAMADGFIEFQKYADKFAHGDGTAKLAVATNHAVVSGKSVYTLNNVIGCKRLVRGMWVTVYETTGNTQRGLFQVEAMDITARKVTLSGTVPSAANTDTLWLEGVSGVTPTGIRGLQYWNSYATSGTTAGVDRAVEPEMIANSVNAAGGLIPEHVMALYHRILERRGEVANELLGVISSAQQAAIYSNVMSVQNYDLSKSSAQATDRLPALKGKKSFMYGDVPHYVDIHEDTDRIDYIVPSTWITCRLDEEKFFQLPGSNQRFFPIAGGSGAPRAGVWVSLTKDEDWATWDPGAQGVVYGLTLPSSGLYT